MKNFVDKMKEKAPDMKKFAEENMEKLKVSSAENMEKLKAANESNKEKLREANEANKAKAEEAMQSVTKALDQNGDGKIDIQDIITMGFKSPGVKIDRTAFLKKELKLKVDKETIEKAIAMTPAKAEIPMDVIDKIADDVIKIERLQVSGISAALGTPGGAAMVATIPADIIQYYGYMLRTAQQLMYLYGFPEIDIDEDEGIDSATMNTIIISLGAMYGVAGANNAIKVMAKSLGEGVEKKLLNKALTKGTLYPIVKKVATWFNIKMTKAIFAGFFKKAIPVVGGVIGGGLTFFSFKPCCDRLKDSLKDTMLSNPNREVREDDINIVDFDYDVDFEEEDLDEIEVSEEK